MFLITTQSGKTIDLDKPDNNKSSICLSYPGCSECGVTVWAQGFEFEMVDGIKYCLDCKQTLTRI